ncbi:dermonecrotic toxin domain-containing protein [Pseudomonas sp. S09G 359]|jgi:sugar-specific transcriptional regulator TrmB|uniref:dermonecrotic toxin domain-containing protein n=1 Tax=Pseudomonas sp. S09G 359 TaxID=2054919 RepID=UPI0012FF1AF2|nr:DUF6543 domain-containing protein [Pseudomonas sp. S09G 359]
MPTVFSPISPAHAVSLQFLSRPSLETVARQMLAEAIRQRFPTLAINLLHTRLASPQADGNWSLRLLMDHVLDYLASGVAPNFDDVAGLPCFLSDHPPTRLRMPEGAAQELQLSVIAELIRELPWALPLGLQNSLIDHWQQTGDTGASRWRWLADLLRETLRVSALRHSGLDLLERESLDQLIQYPDRDSRIERFGEHAVYAYCLQATLTHQSLSTRLLSPELMLVRVVAGRTLGLLCKPDGSIECLRSVETFTETWARRLATHYNVEAIACQRYEPDGNVFDAQAMLILNQQLENLAALRLPAGQPLAMLHQVYRQLTDPGLFFIDSLQVSPAALAALSPRIPDWLSHASGADQMRYREYCLALASAKKRSTGRTFLSGISDIRTYAADTLWQQMKRDEVTLGQIAADQSQADCFKPDDLELDFAVAAGYPGGAGIIEHRSLTLTELALKNLVGKPRGQATLRHRHAKPLPAWLTADYLSALVQQVDIGKAYPALLRTLLLEDSAEARQRETWFADQLSVQLPLQALELALKPPHALSRKGVHLVAALMQPNASQREVDGQPVVIRALALLRKPEAGADAVNTMFIIEAQDTQVGPHLLYRPLYADALLEFATRQALLEAIATPGELQTSVLTWLSNGARAVYDNGGFLQPHYVRFGQGDEFAPLQPPPPASLATDGASDELHQCLLNGRLMQYLFGSTARALVDQAERDSVSNNESRWAVLLEGGGLLFSSLLLPWLRGPAMLTGWLLALMASASQDIPALANPDPVTRELAAVDTLLNLGMLLLHLAPTPAITQPAIAGERLEQFLKPAVPRRESWPIRVAPTLSDNTVAVYGQWPGANQAPLDFSFANSRNQLTSAQRARLVRFKVPPPASLPEPIASGPDKGLYLIDRSTYALIEGDLFQVGHDADARVIVDPTDIRTQGPYLRLDDGRWVMDLRLRLRGGMPNKQLVAERQRKAARKQALQGQFELYLQQQVTEQRRVDLAENLWLQAQNDPRESAQERIRRRQRFDVALQQQTGEYEKILTTRQEREQLLIPLPPAAVARLMESAINNARKSVVFAGDDRTELYSANTAFTRQGPSLNLAVSANQREYLGFIHALTEINARQIHWLEFKDRYLQALFDLGEAGTQTYTRLTANRPATEYSALGVKNLQVRSLKFLCLKQFEQGPALALDNIFDTLQLHVRTHSELNDLALPPAEQLEVLSSLVEHYGEALDGLKGIGIVNADELLPTDFNRLLVLVESLYQDAARQLAAEVKPDPQPRRRQPKRPMVVSGKPAKKVIKTRKGMIIGELKPASTTLPIDVVEVRSEDTDQLLSSYSRHDDVWDEIRIEPAPASPRQSRNVQDIKAQANRLLAGLQEHLNRANSYLKVTRHPQELEEVLQYQANRLASVAGELERAAGERTDAERTLLENMRDAALRLNTHGKELRISASLQLPPTHANLEYLLLQDQVQIASLGQRLPMRGEQRDFIQEYAINDKKGFPLWYAHFHYPSATTPKLAYTAAHLKTRAQRKHSYQSLLSNAHDSQSIVNVHRGLIGRNLAERRFLPLVQ